MILSQIWFISLTILYHQITSPLSGCCRRQRRPQFSILYQSVPMFLLHPGLDCLPTLPLRGEISFLCYILCPTQIFTLSTTWMPHKYLLHRLHPQRTPADQAAAASVRGASVLNYHPWVDTRPAWVMNDSALQSDVEVLEEEMLRAGIMASLQDVPDSPDSKVEVSKSSVSSLRSVKYPNFLWYHFTFPSNSKSFLKFQIWRF